MKTKVPLLLALLTFTLCALVARPVAADPLRVWVSYADSASFAPLTVVTLMLTGTDDGGYVIERRPQPGPWTEFITIGPELGFGRELFRHDLPGPAWTIYPGPGYVFPVEFIDSAPAAQYRAKKL